MLFTCLSSGFEVSIGMKPCFIDCLEYDLLRLIKVQIKTRDDNIPKHIPII